MSFLGRKRGGHVVGLEEWEEIESDSSGYYSTDIEPDLDPDIVPDGRRKRKLRYRANKMNEIQAIWYGRKARGEFAWSQRFRGHGNKTGKRRGSGPRSGPIKKGTMKGLKFKGCPYCIRKHGFVPSIRCWQTAQNRRRAAAFTKQGMGSKEAIDYLMASQMSGGSYFI
ncbi:hypothetical protein AAMO2058_001449900 [Amorphochlora amoebiformis]